MKLKWRLVVSLLIICLSIPNVLLAQENQNLPTVQYCKGEVTSVTPIDVSVQRNTKFQGERVSIKLTSGPDAGKVVNTINYVSGQPAFDIQVKAGDKIIVAITNDFGATNYHVSDFDRFDYVYILAGIFVLALVALGGWIGFKSVLALGFSIIVIFKFFVEQALSNHINLTLLTLLVSAVIAGATQLTISGFTKKTLAAILGTVGGVVVAGFLSMISIYLMHLTGLDSEEAIMLKNAKLFNVDFQGILFAGMVFGALGAVMDVTISISSAIFEVKSVQPTIDFKDMIKAGMNVGRDIMGTMSNTLILAYTGSSLPLMLLITSQRDISMLKILNLNLIVTEIARALTGSIGLICAIPLTAVISAVLFNREKQG